MELFFTFGQKNGAVLRLENGPLQMRSVGVFNGAEDPLLGRLARPQAAQRTGQTGLDTGTGLGAFVYTNIAYLSVANHQTDSYNLSTGGCKDIFHLNYSSPQLK